MKSFFKELIEYSHYCNKALITACHEHNDKLSEKSVRLINHILNVHHIWNRRIIPSETEYQIWEIHLPENYAAIEQNNFETSIKIIELYDLDRRVGYVNTKGKPLENSVQDILFQIINHSTYHRGQLATEFRLANLEPLLTEFIAYKWQAEGQL